MTTLAEKIEVLMLQSHSGWVLATDLRRALDLDAREAAAAAKKVEEPC